MNTQKLNEKIDNLKQAGICDKGIQAVRELVEEITDQKLTPKIETKYHAGQWFKRYDDEYGLLAQTGSGVVTMISIADDSANRVREGITVKKNCYNVTPEEFVRIAGEDWTLVARPF